jgi:hypothetical protein
MIEQRQFEHGGTLLINFDARKRPALGVALRPGGDRRV